MRVKAEEMGGSRNRGAARGLFRVAATIPLAFALLALLAPAAWAHEGTATISCKKVIYTFSQFSSLPGNTVHEEIYEDGFKIDSQVYTFNGPSGGNTVSIKIVGSQTVEARAHWDTNGLHGAFEDTKSLVKCGGIG